MQAKTLAMLLELDSLKKDMDHLLTNIPGNNWIDKVKWLIKNRQDWETYSKAQNARGNRLQDQVDQLKEASSTCTCKIIH